MSVWNRGRATFTIQPMERIAQLVVVPVLQVGFNLVEQLRRQYAWRGRFGSTGKH